LGRTANMFTKMCFKTSSTTQDPNWDGNWKIHFGSSIEAIFNSITTGLKILELLGTGGVAKVAEYFCHLCMCKSSNILCFTEGLNCCAQSQKNEISKCYHYDVLASGEALATFQSDLINVLNNYVCTYNTSFEHVKMHPIGKRLWSVAHWLQS